MTDKENTMPLEKNEVKGGMLRRCSLGIVRVIQENPGSKGWWLVELVESVPKSVALQKGRREWMSSDSLHEVSEDERQSIKT